MSEAAGKATSVMIRIDGKPYEAPETEITGAQLRRLSNPPIGPNSDLYL